MRFFIDMDGTLARFHDEVQYLERMYEQGFFLNLKPFEEAVNGINELAKTHDVYILSAVVEGEPPYCMDEKHRWIDKYLPAIDDEHRIFTKVGVPKENFIEGGVKFDDVLYDDYNKNLEEWSEAGGIPIKCVNNINHRGLHGRLWEGMCIDNTTDKLDELLKLYAVELMSDRETPDESDEDDCDMEI